MRDNHKAVRIFVEFNRIVSRLGDEYGNSALLRCAYLALPKRLKDEMIYHPKLNSLESFRELVLHLDQRYWERRAKLHTSSVPLPSLRTSPISRNPRRPPLPRTTTGVLSLRPPVQQPAAPQTHLQHRIRSRARQQCQKRTT